MATACTAVHLRTGDTSAASLVEGWFQHHRVRYVDHADAYECCVHLLRHSDAPPDLVFVGVDWLTSDETQILHYVRDVWPGAILVVYGDAGTGGDAGDSPLTVVLSSRSALRDFLAEGPAGLRQRLLSGESAREDGQPMSAPAADVRKPDSARPAAGRARYFSAGSASEAISGHEAEGSHS